jgi:flagellar secretion chaperone FliS
MESLMNPNVAARYQAVQIRTEDPGEALIALYDGLFRFLNVARYGLRNGQRARAGEAISKAHAIISEFYLALDHSQAPEMCANLAALYNFSLERLTTANVKNDANPIDEVVRVLGPIRDAFTTVVRAEAAKAATEARKVAK